MVREMSRWLVLWMVLPVLARAQESACVPSGALPDSVPLDLSVRVAKTDFMGMSDANAKTVADAIASAFVRVPINVWPAYQVAELPGQRVTAYPVVAGEYRFGGGRGTSVKATSLVPELDSALVSAIRLATAATEVSSHVEASTEYSVFLTPTAVPPISTSILSLRVPRYVVERPLRDRENNGSPMQYSLPASGMSSSGRLTAWLVVDSKGSARRETLQVLFSGGRYLETDARPVLFSRYRPTIIGGCAVATLIIRSIEFKPK